MSQVVKECLIKPQLVVPGVDIFCLTEEQTTISVGWTGLRSYCCPCWGPFPRLTALHWEKCLFIADTIFCSTLWRNPYFSERWRRTFYLLLLTAKSNSAPS